MRSCFVCFYYRANPLDANEGECMNRPPMVFKVENEDGTVTFMNVRPNVDGQDYCSFFGYRGEVNSRDRKAQTARQAAAQAPAPHKAPAAPAKPPADQPGAAGGVFETLAALRPGLPATKPPKPISC